MAYETQKLLTPGNLLDENGQLQESGWAGLTAKESGRVGAAMRHPPKKQE